MDAEQRRCQVAIARSPGRTQQHLVGQLGGPPAADQLAAAGRNSVGVSCNGTLPAAGDVPAREVDRETPPNVTICRSSPGRAVRPAQQRTDAGQQLVDPERLRQVVVRPRVERAHLLPLVVDGGEEQDRLPSSRRGAPRVTPTPSPSGRIRSSSTTSGGVRAACDERRPCTVVSGLLRRSRPRVSVSSSARRIGLLVVDDEVARRRTQRAVAHARRARWQRHREHRSRRRVSRLDPDNGLRFASASPCDDGQSEPGARDADAGLLLGVERFEDPLAVRPAAPPGPRRATETPPVSPFVQPLATSTGSLVARRTSRSFSIRLTRTRSSCRRISAHQRQRVRHRVHGDDCVAGPLRAGLAQRRRGRGRSTSHQPSALEGTGLETGQVEQVGDEAGHRVGLV